jgi:ADP-heptose:LPS heptosyltransferase
MALRAAKQLYPQLEIHFLARERFSSAALRVPWIHKVITLPTETLLGPLLLGEKTETQALSDVARWVAPLVGEPWDMIVNWSFSDASSFLTGLLPARVKLGYTRRRDSTFSGADGWSHYIQAIVQGKISQNIHLTDILTTQLLTAMQIHSGEPLTDGNSAATSKNFFTLSLDHQQIQKSSVDMRKKWIAIQLGAGQESKTWDPKNWVKLIQYILKRNSGWGIYLLGGKEDLARAQIILDEVGPIAKKSNSLVSLVGDTNFDLWASIVSRCQWLFAGDTAAIHLASVLGTRILNLSIGPVRYTETGPYGNGHYIIASNAACEGCSDDRKQADQHTCRNLSAEAVYATWLYGSNEWSHRRQFSLENHFTQLSWREHLDSVRIYRSKIRQGNDGGGVVYESMVQAPLQMIDWTSMVMGHIARFWYCGWVPAVGQEISRNTLSPTLLQKLRELNESSEVLSKICNEASKTAMELNRKSSHLKSKKLMGVKDREEIQNLGKALLDLELLIERLGQSHAPLRAFSQMAKVLMHHLKGSDIGELGMETAQSYRQLSDGIQILREWIKFTLELVKPKAIHPSPLATIETLNKSSDKEISP